MNWHRRIQISRLFRHFMKCIFRDRKRLQNKQIKFESTNWVKAPKCSDLKTKKSLICGKHFYFESVSGKKENLKKFDENFDNLEQKLREVSHAQISNIIFHPISSDTLANKLLQFKYMKTVYFDGRMSF